MCFEQLMNVIQTSGLIIVGLGQVIFAWRLYKVAKNQYSISESQKKIMDGQKDIFERQVEFYELWAILEQTDRQIKQKMEDYVKMGPAQNTDIGKGILNEIQQMLTARKIGKFHKKISYCGDLVLDCIECDKIKLIERQLWIPILDLQYL